MKGIADYGRRSASRGKELVKSWLAKLARSRIHFLRLSFDVARENRSVDGPAKGELFSGSGCSRARRKQGERGRRGGGNESNELPRQIFLPACHRETVYPAIFVVVARDDADAQSFSRAPFSNSAYQSGNLLPSLLY